MFGGKKGQWRTSLAEQAQGETAGAPEKGGESAAGKVMTGRWWWWWLRRGWGGLTRHEVRGQKGNWRKERKMEKQWGDGEGKELEEER